MKTSLSTIERRFAPVRLINYVHIHATKLNLCFVSHHYKYCSVIFSRRDIGAFFIQYVYKPIYFF